MLSSDALTSTLQTAKITTHDNPAATRFIICNSLVCTWFQFTVKRSAYFNRRGRRGHRGKEVTERQSLSLIGRSLAPFLAQQLDSLTEEVLVGSLGFRRQLPDRRQTLGAAHLREAECRPYRVRALIRANLTAAWKIDSVAVLDLRWCPVRICWPGEHTPEARCGKNSSRHSLLHQADADRARRLPEHPSHAS